MSPRESGTSRTSSTRKSSGCCARSAAAIRSTRRSTRCTTRSSTRVPNDRRCPCCRRAEARAYGHEVRGRVLDLLDRAPFTGTRLLGDGFAFGMIAQHEVQHDETMLITHQIRAGAPVLAAASSPGPGARRRVPAAVRGTRPRRPVHHGYLHRSVGAGQRAARAHRGRGALLSRHRPGDLRRLRPVHRGRRVRRSALVDPGRLGPPAEDWADRAAVLASGTAASGSAGSSAGRSRSRWTSRCCTCAGTRRTRTPAGPGGGCRPRPSGRRRPASIPPPV